MVQSTDLKQNHYLWWTTIPVAFVSIGLHKRLAFIKLYRLLKYRTVLQIWLFNSISYNVKSLNMSWNIVWVDGLLV